MIRILGLAAFSVVLAVLLFVRLAPSDPLRWHIPVEGQIDANFAGGALRVLTAGPDALAQADGYMLSLPRTKRLAGSVAEGRVTYVTRSKVFGFPDYTTLEVEGDLFKAFARLRFGRSDLGVNSERLHGLIAALEVG